MMRKWQLALLLTAVLVETAAAGGDYQPGESRWWKGNTHTHSWWSDGDSPPEVIAAWYKNHDYDFLVLSDHNIMQRGKKWYPINSPVKRKALSTYREQFGDKWVVDRVVDGTTQVRLKTLDEFRTLFEEAGGFIFVKGEEITDAFKRHPVHVNGVNINKVIAPQGGDSVSDTIQNNMDAVIKQAENSGRPMLAHLNHPNFHYAITPQDVAQLRHDLGQGFMEIYNGHPSVANHGNEAHPSAERMWDIVLTKRLGQMDRSGLYGVATDDAHEYTKWGPGAVNPGRGWVMVRSQRLTPDSITAAMKRGDFYNSTGVTLNRLKRSEQGLSLAVDAEPGVSYTIEFIGTRRSADIQGKQRPDEPEKGRQGMRYSDAVGKVLKKVEGTKAGYKLEGDELYVRARVTSDKPHPNPHEEGDMEKAWTQPVFAASEQ